MLGDQLLEQEQFKKKQQKLFQQQRKFRNLQADKKYFAEESINFIKKQKMTMDKLKKQNQALKELIAKVNNEKTTDNKNHQSMQNMKEFLSEINIAIKEQKQIQKNIDIHIANFQKKIVQKKKNCVGVNSGAQNQNNLQKQIKILENRLDKANQKFNETIAVNKDLKNVIDSLRKERVIFDNLYKKLESQLHEKRKKMADIIQKANNAYEDRDKANNQITTLKQQAKKEAVEFEKQIKEMSHLMQKIKLSTFVKKGVRNNFDTTGANFYDTEQPFFNETKSKQTKKSCQQMQKIQKFRQDFAKIQAATEIQNFQQLLRIFSENEEKNFQMFKFVNLQSNQIEQLQYEVAKLKQQLEDNNEQPQDTEKQKYIHQMQDKLKSLEGSVKEAEDRYKSSQREAKILSSLIERIFETIQCDRQLAKQIGGSKTISQTNFLVFLAVIQHKATQIINTFKELSNTNMISTQNKLLPIQPGILTFEDFQDNEEYDKILTMQQLQRKAKQFIMKEQNQKNKKKETRPKKK